MSLATALMSYAQSKGRNTTPLFEALAQKHAEKRMAGPSARPVDRPIGQPSRDEGQHYPPAKATGGFLQLPTSYKTTHQTSGLPGYPAVDIMAKAGTVVGAPEAGKVVYFHPTGAQGGGSMMFDPDAPGPNYWLGHLDAGIRPGSHVKRGQRIALVSSRHAAPHVHEARNYG